MRKIAIAVLLMCAMGATTVAHSATKRQPCPGGGGAGDCSKPVRVYQQQPARASSDESTRERSARLRRECKGRPNGGACLGYGVGS